MQSEDRIPLLMTGVPNANIRKWKTSFCQGGGKRNDDWPDERDATQPVVSEGGDGVVSDYPA